MKIKLLILLFYCAAAFGESPFSSEAYMKRFMMFQAWYQQLPFNPDQNFISFIDERRPLSNALRDKWLYELARMKNWKTYKRHYVASNDPNLQCFALIAEYHEGNQAQALAQAKALWLSPTSLPASCNPIFEVLRKTTLFNDDLITARIALALSHQNLALARYLLKQFNPAKKQEEQVLLSIYQTPKKITALSSSPLHEIFYLYGLKRILSTNLHKAAQIWALEKTQKILKTPKQQDFLTQLAMLKAIKHEPDTTRWFSKIKPAYYHERLLEWQIRHALMQKDYTQVLRLIYLIENKHLPDWQYWRARALEAQGKQHLAEKIYRKLAQRRHYYGFLASARLKQNPQFEHEIRAYNLRILKPYQPILNEISFYFRTGQKRQASQVIHHFASELPKDYQSALAWWVETKLRWHAKSVQLGDNEKLQNQLALRFPLIYQNIVSAQAKTRQLPPELIYAIMRQESVYREDIVSNAGALGLMQMMPATAKLMSKIYKIHFKDKKELFQQDKNITLGSAYLADLAKKFNNHPILMAAAYNAGPGKVKHWLHEFEGDDIDRFIEIIPWQETRNYLKNVLAYYVVYQYRLQKKIVIPVLVAK